MINLCQVLIHCRASSPRFINVKLNMVSWHVNKWRSVNLTQEMDRLMAVSSG